MDIIKALPIPESAWIHDYEDVLLFQTADSRVLFHVGTKEIREAVDTWHKSLFMVFQVTSCIACLWTKIWLGEESAYC